jgi:hypothetical protein
VLDSSAVGVPEITPVVVEKLRPAVLSAGEIEKLVAVPAVELPGEKLAALDLVATSVLDDGYVMPAGTLSAMTAVSAMDWLPVRLAATIVIVLVAKTLVKVPVMTPVEGFRARPIFAKLVAELPETV